MPASILEPDTLLDHVRELPGGRELLELAASREGVELVGGAVRDLTLGRTPRELDVVVATDAEGFARELARSLDAGHVRGASISIEPTLHERFGTALLSAEGLRIDIATRRSESYPQPGALPQVAAGSAQQDLQRRDFTVNAIAIALGGADAGSTRAAPGALEDLRERRLRVLHDESFREDPTRLLRLARYAARLGFEVEPHTAQLVEQALAAGALQTVSGARIGSELRLALAEPGALEALAQMQRLGLLAAIDPELKLDRALAERALSLLAGDGRDDLLVLASLAAPAAPSRERLAALLDWLEFPAGERDRAALAGSAARELAAQLARARRPSQIASAAGDEPLEAVALAGALSESAEGPATHWLRELRRVRLRIDGDDLIAAGMPEGPEIGRALQELLRARLDGELADERDAQLRAVAESARG